MVATTGPASHHSRAAVRFSGSYSQVPNAVSTALFKA